MKMKVSELTGKALDWAVDQIDGHYARYKLSREPGETILTYAKWASHSFWRPSSDWKHGGPIIERNKVSVSVQIHDSWSAHAPYSLEHWKYGFGPTPLIAAMRCYVQVKFGEEIDIPEELL